MCQELHIADFLANTITSYPQGNQIMLVVVQIFGLMLIIVAVYSALQDTTVQAQFRKLIAVVGTVHILPA
ncbi:hypothetical protein GW17_00020007, partial [Ensete ventricosum]